jgi:hypothetical protein
MEALDLLIGTLLGGVATYGILHLTGRFRRDPQREIRTEATVLLERVEKVFKVVLAEGHFSEIYDYAENKNMFFGWVTDSKKALIVVKAKVLVGFDFGKVRLRWEEGQRQLVIEEIPAPEILSIDSDYNVYDIEQGVFNRFNTQEYTKMLVEAKQTLHNRAVASELPVIANKQLAVLLDQLALSMGWQVRYALPPTAKKELPG